MENELSDCLTHILAVTETWLTPRIDSSCVAVKNYNLVRNDRAIFADGQTRYIQGGGDACYLHNSLSYSILECSVNDSINTPEYLFLDIKSSSINLLFIIMYRRPEGHLFAEFLIKFNSHISAYKNIIVTGDLNCNLLDNTFDSKYLKDFIYDYSLFSVPFGPTHHSFSSSQIDVMIVDSGVK